MPSEWDEIRDYYKQEGKNIPSLIEMEGAIRNYDTDMRFQLDKLIDEMIELYSIKRKKYRKHKLDDLYNRVMEILK